MGNHYNYSMFQHFIDHYIPEGFRNISRVDPLVIEMEAQLNINNQFFYVADLLQLQLLFTSNGITKMIGVQPEELNFFTLLSRAHPGDQRRYNHTRSKLIELGPQLFLDQKDFILISSHFRIRNPSDKYTNLFIQAYLFQSEPSEKTVYFILIVTDISKFKVRKASYHFYMGDDRKMFRYPDTDLLEIGYSFSDREFEILQNIAKGLDSEQIASKLFLSVNTINTHRRNILKKTKKASTHDLVIELQENGIL